MKKLIFAIAALFLLVACENGEKTEISEWFPTKLPNMLNKQWINHLDGTDNIYLWDFTANEGRIIFLKFNNLEELTANPEYHCTENSGDIYRCFKRGSDYKLEVYDSDGAHYAYDYVISNLNIATASVYGLYYGTDTQYWFDLESCPVKVNVIKDAATEGGSEE